ncbi:tRNA pseudouridine(55) synthase TruB [Alteromonas aestuariivivens]|uniref:tRNA pseudouridine synthase B n=1 Tax=Alteromonas aestuariivivens TaxID=1938339 RepID=A0A3D8M423_9ALTE|nr:tRNA pseudouridine(55) synthase TruB [Alteromonas aestuariivivens]RDV24493.1 tRNA pseudouridine(55) synthase TruB [Alteromonas aestuariivivens]
MARRRKGRNINGIVLLDKPLGGSSNQVLQKVRWLYQAAKAGHTGALDPLASGMLPICLGEATKFSQFLLDADKTYEVTAQLGVRTTTSDADGEVVEEKPVMSTPQQVEEACLGFIGPSKQVPSMYSALKHQGKPLYFYARQGITIEREARDIVIHQLEIIKLDLPFVEMRVSCTKGTYIRSLVDDIGQKLGCGAYVTRLHRTQVADYPADRMVDLPTLEAMATQAHEHGFEQMDELLLPMDTAVKTLPALVIDDEQAARFENGQSVVGSSDEPLIAHQQYRIYHRASTGERFLGVGEGVTSPKDQPVQLRDQGVYAMPRRRVVY